MPGQFHYVITNDFAAFAHLAAAVSANSLRMGLSKHVSYQIDLVLEELITNIIKYGFDDTREHRIEVEIVSGGAGVAVLTIRDDGHFFDPTGTVNSNTDTTKNMPVEEMRVGGWGLSLVRKNSREFTYAREGGHNLLRIVFGD